MNSKQPPILIFVKGREVRVLSAQAPSNQMLIEKVIVSKEHPIVEFMSILGKYNYNPDLVTYHY